MHFFKKNRTLGNFFCFRPQCDTKSFTFHSIILIKPYLILDALIEYTHVILSS